MGVDAAVVSPLDLAALQVRYHVRQQQQEETFDKAWRVCGNLCVGGGWRPLPPRDARVAEGHAQASRKTSVDDNEAGLEARPRRACGSACVSVGSLPSTPVTPATSTLGPLLNTLMLRMKLQTRADSCPGTDTRVETLDRIAPSNWTWHNPRDGCVLWRQLMKRSLRTDRSQRFFNPILSPMSPMEQVGTLNN